MLTDQCILFKVVFVTPTSSARVLPCHHLLCLQSSVGQEMWWLLSQRCFPSSLFLEQCKTGVHFSHQRATLFTQSPLWFFVKVSSPLLFLCSSSSFPKFPKVFVFLQPSLHPDSLGFWPIRSTWFGCRESHRAREPQSPQHKSCIRQANFYLDDKKDSYFMLQNPAASVETNGILVSVLSKGHPQKRKSRGDQ